MFPLNVGSEADLTTQETTSATLQSGSAKMATRVKGAMMPVSVNHGRMMFVLEPLQRRDMTTEKPYLMPSFCAS